MAGITKVTYRITKSDGTIDHITVEQNNTDDINRKLTSYFTNENASHVPGLAIWAMHDNAPKSYYKTIIKGDDIRVDVKRH